jgi:pentose-5-phosphate-3-epimerase
MLKDEFVKKINFFLYKKKHLAIYILIGFLSLIFELSIRKLILNYFTSNIFFLHFSVFFGVIFAFYFNIKFNFNVPKIYLRRSLFYFILISISSYLFQYLIRNKLELSKFTFEESRIIISGIFFLVAYFFHIKFSFRDSRKVGVAIYANGYEDINKIFNKIGPYPDFVHVDIVDSSMNKNAKDTNLSKLEVVKAYWPNHKIETHIMSVDPLNILNNSLLENSDIIYIHHEIKNREETIKKILEKNKIPGLVLHCVKQYENLEEIIGNFEEILVLSIKKPGQSGQVFEDKSYTLINRINLLKERKSLNLCVDGGVKSNLINKFISEKVVSGSDVLNSSHPIKKIMKLQTVARYEK